MAKNVLKQVVITLLIVIAIILILAIIFYQYLPTNKIIPAKVSEYETPESVKAEISENKTEQEFSSENEVIEVTDSDLAIYKSTQSYNPGKSDPFAKVESENANTTSASSSSTSSTTTVTQNGEGAKSSSQVVDKNTTDNYYKSSGIEPGTK